MSQVPKKATQYSDTFLSESLWQINFSSCGIPPCCQNVQQRAGVTFSGLKGELQMGISGMGFQSSPIKDYVRKIIGVSRTTDVMARAKNGAEKSLSYLIALLEKIDTNMTKGRPQGIIIVPTAELALQTSASCMALGKHLKVQVMVSAGDTDLNMDIIRLSETVHIVVATPGRIFELMEKNVAVMDSCRMLFLDQADRLSLDFGPLLDRVLAQLPVNRQVMLFAATFPVSMDVFKCRLTNPVTLNLMNEGGKASLVSNDKTATSEIIKAGLREILHIDAQDISEISLKSEKGDYIWTFEFLTARALSDATSRSLLINDERLEFADWGTNQVKF